MKFIYAFLIAALLALPAATTSSAIEIDGTYDSDYGSALAIQQLGTGFGDNNLGNLHAANGSELDAAYGFISNSVMYLFLAGNIEGATNSGTANKFEIFIDSIPGHGQNTLTNNNPNVDFNGLNRMGGNAGVGTNGLTFDLGFAPDYWIGTTAAGGATTNANNISFYANYAVLTDNGGSLNTGYYMGTSSPTNNTLSGGTNPFGVKATINNSNILGVDGTNCFLNSLGATQSVAAATVGTGMELSIPLSAISSGPVSSVKVCVLLNGQNHDFISNQLLPPIATNDCFGNLGEPRAVNLSTLPGQHYFTVPIVGCNYSISPLNALYPAEGGAGSVSMTAGIGCSWAATSQVAWVTITSGASGSGPGVLNYSVATNTTTIGRSGTIIIGGQTFAINQYGQPLAVTIDGSVETNHYGCTPLAVQAIGVATFGDSSLGDVDFANGSELDSAYGVIENGVLYLTLGGNLASDFTKLELFFDTASPGGQSTLTTNYPDVDFNGLNRMGTDGNGATNGTPGLTFDTTFAANYWIGITCGGAPFSVFANYAQLTPGGSNGYFLGSTVGNTNGTLFGGNANPFGIQAAVNNINIAGVTSSGCFDDPSTYNQGSVMTGVELGIPLAALGSPTGAVKVCAFVNASGHGNVSNEILGPIWDGTGLFCQADLGEPSLINLSLLPGQHYFVVGPQMRVTGITRSGSNISVSWLTAANSNLVYQLQSKSAITNATWNDLGSPTNGTGAVTTQTDSGAAANSTMFYRVKQTPVCIP